MMAVFSAVALIDNSAAFRISYESQIWVQMQAPGAITSVITNSTIPDLSDNSLFVTMTSYETGPIEKY